MIEITVKLTDQIAQELSRSNGDIPRQLLEALALENYRSGKLSTSQVAELLHLDADEAARFLASHHANQENLEELKLPQEDPDWEAFRRALPELLKSEKGKFVAISNGQIIDTDPSDLSLLERVVRQHPDKRILIQRIIEGGLQDIHIDTPEFEFTSERVA